jgi:hypothetical protein
MLSDLLKLQICYSEKLHVLKMLHSRSVHRLPRALYKLSVLFVNMEIQDSN